jgi:nucleotide-binding universal stress UspA family protein
MKILVPLDGPPSEESVLPFCLRMVRECDSAIVLTHVVAAPAFMDPEGVYRAERYLDDVARAFRAAGVHVLHAVRQGNPAEEIVGLARELGADLIAMPTRRGPQDGGRLLGETMESVLLLAGRPVVAINGAEPALDTQTAGATRYAA